jgi:hypothetical protein
MGQEKREDPGRFVGDGFAPASTNDVGDWGGPDGFSLWDAAEQNEENGFEDWEGRQETHDMFSESYD